MTNNKYTDRTSESLLAELKADNQLEETPELRQKWMDMIEELFLRDEQKYNIR